ncbi:WSC domain-containing protein 1-like [Gigantopelta aegis]|uniref:WSC domain-containing protein 1-like n=1 Tax=Gigantopelta aegis TaxID=1735272 RepID=UPI001B88C320|nr:WSC domain-containing protein 1-like [Gigantopelta aegis]
MEMHHRSSCRCKVRSSVFCVVVYIVAFNVLCLYYLTKSASPWMSHHGPFYFPANRWTCKPVRVSPRPLTLTALASFPGSGNTWVRHLVQQATGIATGSLYNDTSLRLQGFPGEGQVSRHVIFVKSHEWGKQIRSKFEKAILLVREPYGTLLAEFNRRHGGHMGHARKEDFGKEWFGYVHKTAVAWVEHNVDWLKFDGPLYVMNYSELRRNSTECIEHLLRFLDVNVTHSDLTCMAKNSQGYFKRLTFKMLDYDPYTSVMKYSISNYIRNVSKEIENYYKGKIR